MTSLIAHMPSLTIRNLDHQTKERLRVRAAQRRRSMEAEARQILRAVLADGDRGPDNLAGAIRERFRAVGGVDLSVPSRQPMRPPPKPSSGRR
jgi:plasmid stability protein